MAGRPALLRRSSRIDGGLAMSGPKPSRKLNKERLNIRLSNGSAEFLRLYASKTGCTISELTEGIIGEYRATQENYFIKSAAYFGFINAALTTMVVTRLFEPQNVLTDSVDRIKLEISKEASRLFGEQPPAPFPDDCSWSGDDRLWRLHQAFAAHYLRRTGDLPQIHNMR